MMNIVYYLEPWNKSKKRGGLLQKISGITNELGGKSELAITLL